jgi:hypothetical protein
MTDYASRITAMFEKYSPERVSRVPNFLEKYRGQEEELLKALVAKYGPEPTPGYDSNNGPEKFFTSTSYTSAPPTTSSSVNESYRRRLTAFYQFYAPDKIAKIDVTLQKYGGHEEALFEALTKMYGPEPNENNTQSSSSSSESDYRARVTAMYQKYAPDKLENVPKIMTTYAGQEKLLMEALVSKYGPEPVVTAHQVSMQQYEPSDEPQFYDE